MTVASMSGGPAREGDGSGEDKPREGDDTRSPNVAPDAVKDPNVKTGGKPGAGPQGEEVDPGTG